MRVRCFDSLGVHRDRPPLRPWIEVRDADPTLERIQQFYVNALRSSGDEDEAKAKTMRYFDLNGLDVDGEKVIGFHVADEEQLDPGLDDPKTRAMEFSNGTADHVSALRSLNERNRRVHERIEAVRVDDRDDRTQPTRNELALVSPTSQTAGNPHGLATFNELARRFWRTA